MTLVGLSWADTGASDIHLLPGLASPELKRLLRGDDFDPAKKETTVKQLFDMSGLSVAFAIQLAGTPASHGLQFSTSTGEVVVDTAAMAGRSFIVTATATQGTATATTRIRFCVHSAISLLWLTPARLTVRHGAKKVRLSLLAQFDDGVIADITNWSPFETPGAAVDRTFVHPKGVDTPSLAWSSAAPAGGAPLTTVDSVTGILDATADAGTSTVTAAFGAQSAQATVVCALPWTTNVRLTHLSGPGTREVNFFPNLLFLPDGFTGADRKDYERMVRMIVTRLSTRNRTRPFAALTGRINYFMGWAPSPDPGVSVLNELDRDEKDPLRARGIELPTVGRPANNWSLENLINAVGLPTPVGDPDGSLLSDARVAGWQAAYGPSVTKARVQPHFAKWLTRNDRILLNEQDTAFHMAFGDRPALAGETTDRGLRFNPRRLANEDFNTFLDSLRGPKGEALGQLWTTGKDRALVVIVCRSICNGGLNATRPSGASTPGHTLGVSLGADGFHKVAPKTNGFGLVPDDVPTDVFFHVWLTVAHEIAHSWNVGDEYGGLTGAPPPQQILTAATDANLQDRASLEDTGLLIPGNLKWGEWPRITKAGVLALAPTLVAGKVQVFLNDAKASRLRVNDIVRLRARPLSTAGPPSTRCKIESITDDTVVMAPLFGAAVDPTKFPAGSILMSPARTKDKDPAADLYGGDLNLADQDVLLRMIDTNNPLNAEPLATEGAAPNDAFGRPCPGVELPVPTAATNFTNRKAPNPPAYSSWTIGIYENGGEYNCGILRPTGICLMGTQFTVGQTLNLYDFCIICRYAMVDAVDPTLHGDVEIDFVGRYGRRGAQ